VKTFQIKRAANYTKPFIPRTRRERYLLEKLWPAVEGLFNCMMDHMPACTSEEERTDEYIIKLRKKFPQYHRRISRMAFERIKETMEGKGEQAKEAGGP
jgi:hypothetical protein